MPVPFPSDEFIVAFRDEINKSAVYKQAAADWEGAITLAVTAEEERGMKENWYVYLDLWHGVCREAKRVTAEEAQKAPYVLTAPLSRWEQVMNKELDPIKGMMQGKIKLKGDLPSIVRRVAAAKELVECTTRIDAVPVDKMP